MSAFGDRSPNAASATLTAAAPVLKGRGDSTNVGATLLSPPFKAQEQSRTGIKIPAYPHFDPPLSKKAAIALVSFPERVASHAFFPLIERKKTFVPFRKKGQSSHQQKERCIRYAARRDSVIFSHYRSVLLPLYERFLAEADLTESVIAYRRVPAATGGYKSSFHFALEAFDKISATGDCIILCLDIEKFFDTIDHECLKREWAALLVADRLPPDHYKVSKL